MVDCSYAPISQRQRKQAKTLSSVSSNLTRCTICVILRSVKMCSKCKTEKEIGLFPWKSKAKGVRAAWCKECHKAYAKESYKKNTGYYIEKAKKNKPRAVAKNKQFVMDYLRLHPCVDCGETDIEVLEFDHIEMIGSSARRVSSFMSHSTETLMSEIEKCEVRCSNCHTRRTRKQTGWFRYFE